MENIPTIIVVSCSNTKPKSLIKLITKETTTEQNGLISQPWSIDTKYYTATVNFMGIDKNYARTDEFNDKVEAVIIHMDSNKKTGLDDLQYWECLEIDCDPEIKLLVSNYCNEDTKITKNQAVDWCLKRGFEFVELYPSNTSDRSEDDIIEEKFGVDRIIEALQSHTWSNLIPKPKDKTKKSDENCSKSDDLEEQDFSNDVDEFTELFSQLNMMKDSLQSMPVCQRKQCAEQMVTAFWKAIGGEEEDL